MKLYICILALAILVSPIQSETVNQPLSYTATGDDGMLGQASYAIICIARTSDSLVNHWDDCTIVASVVPWPPATNDVLMITIDVEIGVPYFYGIKIADEAFNWSDVSNIITVIYADTTKPDAVTDLQLGAPQ